MRFICFCLIFIVFSATVICGRKNNRIKAVSVLRVNGTEEIRGTIRLNSVQNNCVRVRGEVRELTPGLHGFHIHEFANFSNGCISAGGHFNPTHKDHGARTDENRHIGDLGNINATADGVANIDLVDCKIKLKGANSILGKSIVVHVGEDDLGRGSFADSKTTGHAGARFACGLITRKSER